MNMPHVILNYGEESVSLASNRRARL